MKKKLLIASDTFLPRWDGVSRFLAEIVPRLSSRYDITVIAPDFEGKGIRIKDVNIVRVPVHSLMIGDYHPPKFKPMLVRKYVKEADIVFTQSLGPIGMLSVFFADRLKKPLYYYTHSIEWELVSKSIDKFKRTIYTIVKASVRYFYNKCDFIFVPSEDVEKILNYNSIRPQKMIIPLGVNSNEFRPVKDKAKAKKKVKVKPDSTVIGFVGRIAREKDLPTLYRAFRFLCKKYDNLKLMIVGGGLRLESIFDSMDNIIHVESTNNVKDYYQAMDIFVLPSLTETSSLATMEAMSCGLPVVATDVGCMQEYINDGKNGFIFPKKDAPVLAKKLSKLLERDGLRRAIGLMARKTVTTKFSWDKTVKEIGDRLG